MLYNQVCCFGNSKKADTERVDKAARTAVKIVGTEIAVPNIIYRSAAVKKAAQDLVGHSLNHAMSSKASRRDSSQRLRCFRTRPRRFMTLSYRQ